MRFLVICGILISFAATAHAGTNASMIPLASSAVFSASNEEVAAAQLKSPGRAFLMSMVIPGSGELYVGKQRGLLHLAAEVGLITAYFLVHRDAGTIQDDYVAYVRQNVAFDESDPTFEIFLENLPDKSDRFSGWNMEDFEHATQTNNWHYVYTEENGQPLVRVGPFYWKDLPENFRTATREELQQAQIDSQRRQEAYNLRADANSRFKLATTLLGLTIGNHLVSAISARIAAKQHNSQHELPTLSMKTTFGHNQLETQLVIQQRF